MTIRTIILAGALAAMVTLGIGGGVGERSSWGVIVQPCAWCGSVKDVEIHHIQPQHLRPDLARDTNNMVSLCRLDHLRVGHRGCFTNSVTNLLLIIKLGHD